MFHSKVFVLTLILVIAASADNCFITTPYGKIRGCLEKNRIDGSEFCAYRGLPYAKKLTEQTKLQDSKPIEPWGEKVHDACEFGNGCLSFDIILQDFVGSLDCLYLNVYVPKNVSKNELLTSMIWIHGGIFAFGSGDDVLYAPNYLIREGVILVTMNYRLGPLGFLNARTPSCPGNMGLKDQNRAIKFYKEIAKYFGGDPEKITLFGESAGSTSTQLHVFSPMSKGLFRSAIQQSGSGFDLATFRVDPNTAINRIKQKLNLKSEDPAGVAEELINEWTALDIIKQLYREYAEEPFKMDHSDFVPTIEEKVEGCDQFLPDHPLNILVSGNYSKIPILIGNNADEAAMFIPVFLKVAKELESNNSKNLIKALTNEIVNKYDDAESMFGQILEHYTGSPFLGGGSEKNFSLLMSDFLFHFSYWTSINFYRLHKSPVYAYYFQYRSQGGILKEILGITEPTCMHAEELEYLFYVNFVDNVFKKGTDKYFLMKFFTKAWTNFAKTGVPSSPNDAKPWLDYGKNMTIMKIDMNPEMVFIKDIENNFNSRMCWILSTMKNEIQKQYEQFNLC